MIKIIALGLLVNISAFAGNGDCTFNINTIEDGEETVKMELTESASNKNVLVARSGFVSPDMGSIKSNGLFEGIEVKFNKSSPNVISVKVDQNCDDRMNCGAEAVVPFENRKVIPFSASADGVSYKSISCSVQ